MATGGLFFPYIVYVGPLKHQTYLSLSSVHNCTLHDLFYSRRYPYNISNLQSQVKLAAFKTNHKSARVSPQLLTSLNVLYNVRITGPNRPQIFTRRMAFSNESILFSFLFHRFVSSYAQRISKVIPTMT